MNTPIARNAPNESPCERYRPWVKKHGLDIKNHKRQRV